MTAFTGPRHASVCTACGRGFTTFGRALPLCATCERVRRGLAPVGEPARPVVASHAALPARAACRECGAELDRPDRPCPTCRAEAVAARDKRARRRRTNREENR